ncbi:MAG: hypothetical protein KIT87_28375 [Anaerolineae bacterium]|nr:hypothetical protein [Anaerolineae bacterium]
MSHCALCVNNEGYQVSLEVGKVYRIIPDAEAWTHGYLRLVDESGEEYAYAGERFFPLDLPPAVEQAILAAEAA